MEGVRQGPGDLAEQDELVHGQGRLATLRLRRMPDHADDVTEIDLEAFHAARLDEQLDLPAPVDEIDEDEPTHIPAGHDAPRHAHRGLELASGLERVRLGADAGDVDAVGESLRQIAHAFESRASCRHAQPNSGTDPRVCPCL